MTALQTATASLAVPKSVINTIVRRAAAPGWVAAELSDGALPHAAQYKTPARNRNPKKRVRKGIQSPSASVFSEQRKPAGMNAASAEQKQHNPQTLPFATSKRETNRPLLDLCAIGALIYA